MRTRDEVLREYEYTVTLGDVSTVGYRAPEMADRIRELEAQLVSNAYTLSAASGEPVAWYAESQSGARSYATKRDDLSYWIDKGGWAIHPLYPHPPAPVVPVVTEGMIDAVDAHISANVNDTMALWEVSRDTWRDILTAALQNAASEGASA